MRRLGNRIKSHTRGPYKGNMPFAIIAVTLLILGSAYTIISAQTEKSVENTETISDELDIVGETIGNTECFVEKGLGEIIFSLSTSSTEGTIEQRTEKYDARAKEWMDFQFPLMDNGVRVELTSFSTELGTENLRLSDNDLTKGSAPSYLIGTGEFEARYSCDSGTTIKNTEFSTDASCALPLVAEQGSIFRNSLQSDGSPLSQMISYQLTAVAQYRVMNGFGALDEYGSMGTMNIITEQDVRTAYNNALDLMELEYFHILPEGFPEDTNTVDLADFMISSGKNIEIDISAIYSQTLISIADDLVLQWADYLYGNLILDDLDGMGDRILAAWNSLKGFFTNKNEFSAAPYIESILSENNLDVDRYRYLMSGKTFDVIVDGDDLRDILGEDACNITMSICYPTVDLMSWNRISEFKSHYDEENNRIREWLTEIINSAAMELGSGKYFGKVCVDIDRFDDTGFMDSICRTIGDALENGSSAFESIIMESITEEKTTDPFYSAIYEVIQDDLYDIYGVSDFEETVYSTLERELMSTINEEYGTVLDEKAFQDIVDGIMNSTELKGAIDGYTCSVESLMDGFNHLREVEEGQDGIIKKICRGIASNSLGFMESEVNVPDRIMSLCGEMRDNIYMNPFCGTMDVNNRTDFTVVNSKGSISRETMSMEMSYSPNITINGPNSNLSECVHYVGFLQGSGASYCTVFTISLRDTIRYNVSSSSCLEDSMGIFNSRIDDNCEIDINIKVAVASAWALQGVKTYEPSNTLLSDAWNALVSLLSPLLEPLRKVMSMIMDALEIMNSAFMEIGKFVSDIVQKLYNALMEPIEELRTIIENSIQGWLEKGAEKIVDTLEWIIDVDASKQNFGFSFLGFTLTITLNLASLAKSTKTLMTMTLGANVSGMDVSGSITIKQKGEGSSKQLLVTGTASIRGDDWDVTSDIDPTMKVSKYMLCISGKVKGTEFDIILPQVVSYNEIDFSLQDIPGLGTLLSNIPLGASKVSVDVGINMKYSAPFKNGLVINEFESNPEGTDTNKEWVELYNASTESIDISDYIIRDGANKTKTCPVGSGEIRPGGRTVINLPGTFLNNSSSTKLKGGDYVLLLDGDGNTVDKTPTKKDTSNDDSTWQRVADASTEWVLETGTPDDKNCGGLLTGPMVRTQIYDIIKESAAATLADIGKLMNTEDLSEFFKIAIQNALDTVIDMLSECLIEASIYLSIDVTDVASAGCVGFEASLSIDSGFAEDALRCLIGEIEELLLNIENPYGIKPVDVIYDNTYLGIKIYTGMNVPKFLGNNNGGSEVQLCVNIKANIACLDRAIGGDTGKWKIVAGVEILDCPFALIPSSLGAEKDMHNDLWLVKATFRQAD